MTSKIPSQQELLRLAQRVHPDYKPVWDKRPPHEQAGLSGYFLPRKSIKPLLCPTGGQCVKWYCPFASQQRFPSDHRYCINVYVGCVHECDYCYVRAYGSGGPAIKRGFPAMVDKDMAALERYDVPPAPVHLSNSTDPFQPLERQTGHTRYALERILAHRHRFTTVTLLTKDPLMPVQGGYLGLFRDLAVLPTDHPRYEHFRRSGHPPFQVQVSLAFWRDDARAVYDPGAPTVQQRIDGLQALHDAGIPLVLRIDPLFPRSPLPIQPPNTLPDFGATEAQTLDDLERLVTLAKELLARHVVYSPARIMHPKGRTLTGTMKSMRKIYQTLASPGEKIWRGRSWRVPKALGAEHVVRPFLEICRLHGVTAKFCMQDLIEIP